MKIQHKEQLKYGTLTELFDIFIIERTKYMKLLKELFSDLRKEVSSRKLDFLLEDMAADNGRQISEIDGCLEKRKSSRYGKEIQALNYLKKECMAILKNTKAGPVRDAGIIALLQKFLHLHLSGIRTLLILSEALEDNQIKEMLNSFYKQIEKNILLLSESACNTINYDAAIDENKKVLLPHYRANL